MNNKRIWLLASSGILIVLIIITTVFVFAGSVGESTKRLEEVYISPSFPLYNQYKNFFSQQKGFVLTSQKEGASIIVDTSIPDAFSKIPASAIYQQTNVLVNDFKDQGTALTLSQVNSMVAEKAHIRVSPELTSFYPNFQETTDIQGFLSQDATHNYAIIPFSALTNQVHVVPIDGNSPIDKSFVAPTYPFSVMYELSHQYSLPTTITNFIATHTYTDRDPTKLHTIIMTGTTAMGRGVFFAMQRHGYLYPARDIADTLKDADITHVSNEVSIASDCTQQVGTLTFCALPSSIQTLQSSGVDIVELTGNHNNDWGTQADLDTLKAYDDNHIAHFGGGKNATDARKPAIMTIGDMKVGFLGYNEDGPTPAWATATTPGAAKLIDDEVVSDIQALRPMVDILFVDFQWSNENDLQPYASQIRTAKEAIDAGADIVTGSQAHRPEGLMFYNGKTVVFGMGNLFFDQMEIPEKRMGYITKHYFYNKKLVSTVLIPTLLFDYSQPHLATGSDAQTIWNMIWQGSINLP